jgi:hypothetical protein
MDEDRVCLLHGAMDELLSGEVWGIRQDIATGVAPTMATQLQEALSGRAWDIL